MLGKKKPPSHCGDVSQKESGIMETKYLVYRQLFQQLAAGHIFQHLHLLYGDTVQADKPFTL